jgi:arsenate reductase-like glutaredoxin family protein
MRVFFYLSNCDTCKRILKTLEIGPSIEQIDIKKNPITETQLDELYSLTQSYEALINKRAQLFKQRGIKVEQIGEQEYKSLLLEHYTFLKRPVLVFDQTIFVGNSPKVIEAAKAFLNE